MKKEPNLKRTSFCFTTETKKQLEELCEVLGENKSQVITRAIQWLHFEKVNNPQPD